MWDANKIGLCPPPIETEKGWLVLYHGVRNTASDSIYLLGLALFDLARPDLNGDREPNVARWPSSYPLVPSSSNRLSF